MATVQYHIKSKSFYFHRIRILDLFQKLQLLPMRYFWTQPRTKRKNWLKKKKKGIILSTYECLLSIFWTTEPDNIISQIQLGNFYLDEIYPIFESDLKPFSKLQALYRTDFHPFVFLQTIIHVGSMNSFIDILISTGFLCKLLTVWTSTE